MFSAPGGTRIDDGDKTKMTNHCVFSANEDHETIRNYAQVEPGIEKLPLCVKRETLEWNSGKENSIAIVMLDNS